MLLDALRAARAWPRFEVFVTCAGGVGALSIGRASSGMTGGERVSAGAFEGTFVMPATAGVAFVASLASAPCSGDAAAAAALGVWGDRAMAMMVTRTTR